MGISDATRYSLSNGLLCLQAFAPGLVQVSWAAKLVDKAQDSAQHLCQPQDPRLQPFTPCTQLTARCASADNCAEPVARALQGASSWAAKLMDMPETCGHHCGLPPTNKAIQTGPPLRAPPTEKAIPGTYQSHAPIQQRSACMQAFAPGLAHAPLAAKLIDKAETAPTPKGARLIHHAKAVAPAPVVRALCSIL